jgi:acyl-coenzyme A thioesterase PaaI-like protein
MTDAGTRPPTAFERSTAVRPLGEGRFAADVDTDWSAPTGPNGGYLAAVLVRALGAGVDPSGERRLRSLTCHYLRSAAAGPLELEVRTLRAGRRTVTASVTGRQGDRDVLTALAVLAAPHLPTAATWGPVPPAVAPAPAMDAGHAAVGEYRRDGGRWLAAPPGMPPIVHQLWMAPQLGGFPFSGRTLDPGEAVETGGWIASPEQQRIDAAYVAQLTDFWWPPAFEVLRAPAAVPTIDLTIHLRADLPPAGLDAQPVLGHYRSTAAAEGFVEEDAALYLADGTLLAQSRQLALLAAIE